MDRGKPFEAKLIAADYLREFAELLQRVDLDAVERVVEHLRQVRDADGTVYVAGNGGSAATASHWANDLGKATKASSRAFMRVMCLSDNVSWLTALANDEGYDRVFSGQLENFAGPGDLFVVISASGNSPNLIEAVELARERGVVTIGAARLRRRGAQGPRRRVPLAPHRARASTAWSSPATASSATSSRPA